MRVPLAWATFGSPCLVSHKAWATFGSPCLVTHKAWSLAAIATAASIGACAAAGPRDVGNQNPRSEFPSAEVAAPEDAGTEAGRHRVRAKPTLLGRAARVIAHGPSHAIALDADNVYFGDDASDQLVALPKRPTEPPAEPRRLARHAPMDGTLSYDPHAAALAWVGSPGDVVLRVSVKGGPPSTLRDGSIFADVVATGGDVFITEASSGGAFLMRVTGATASRLGTIKGTPRGIAVDAERVYIASSARLVSTPRTPGPMTELSTAGGFASPRLDEASIYVTMATATAGSYSLVRIPKRGGALETLATNVREAPIAIAKGRVFWFDANRPNLLALDVRGASSAAVTISSDPLFEHVRALAVDESGAYAAVGSGDDAAVVAIPLE